MQKMYDNRILTATLYRSSENPGYPIANVQDTKVLRQFRTLSASNEWIKISSTITASRFAIMGHNLSASAVITLQGNDTDVWTTPSFEEIITWKAGIILHSFTEATYNYWRLVITDSGRSYIAIGELYIGTYLQEPNIKLDTELDDETTGEGELSSSGQLYGDDGYELRNFTINYSPMNDAVRESMRVWWRMCKNNRPFILGIWANREDIESLIYCHTAQKAIKWKRTGYVRLPWSTSIKYEECY
ncbi:MAG: hypothetical protein JXN64_01325 [Spirochaetes bacterium]|nr:hypothetical protein [Spirochaetota bacterium]